MHPFNYNFPVIVVFCCFLISIKMLSINNNSDHSFSSEEDEEVFEDNPEEYIRRDIEGSGTNKDYFKILSNS